ncbi:hypothetical protein QTP70_017928 [Hemibagrus guttatus]|uniref:Uncharacterized protein n=1 Tax=Hemibagrus guttatus TaxID=175788 RepID=A0AAE0QHG4_9TELE|nr:hypothetical protein QTP70_017928 [Hemibagrus guttatus]KAK3553199.1 hypothetical protein QTP86_031770 [Hemibagrus guttatus]
MNMSNYMRNCISFKVLTRCKSNYSGNPLHRPGKSSAKPIQNGNHPGREFGDGETDQPASGLLCPFWANLCLALDYPKCMKNTFHFIQQVMLNLGKGELAPKIQSLKIQLAL